MNEQERERLGHRAGYRSGFQPSRRDTARVLGLRPRLVWRAPSVLLFAAMLSPLGCNSAPKPTPISTTIQPTTAYPPRPSAPPPPIRVFHQDPTSITLVTDSNATDDQITAILWQLRDATRTHTLDRLHIDQKVIDHRDPIVWFHLYRGAKCASEKYASGPPPCGASYHAAGDFTIGGFHNPNHDDGLLIHDPDHQTELWDPDAPYTPPAP